MTPELLTSHLTPAQLEGLVQIHQDLPCEDIRCGSPTFNPMTSCTTIPVCYHQKVNKTVTTWFGFRTRLETEMVHKHFTATLTPARPWEYVGTDELPPLAVAKYLSAVNHGIRGAQAQSKGPEYAAHGIKEIITDYDSISREQFYELLCEIPQFGDELKAYVRRADKVDAAFKSNPERN